MKNNGIFKPNPYVEITIDGNSPRKTEIIKHSYLPVWNECFTVCVTPSSEITLRVLDRSSFLKDALLGEKSIQLAQILEYYHGRCDNLEIVLDLLGSPKPEGRTKCGELVIVLNGLRVDSMAIAESQQHVNGVTNGTSNTSSSVEANVCNGRSIILSGGIRTRIRGSTMNWESFPSTSNPPNSDSSFVLTTRGSNDHRNIRVTSNDSASRRFSELTDDQSQQLLNRTVNKLGITTVAYPSNPSRGNGSNWDQNQIANPSNGTASNQRPYVVILFLHFPTSKC